jgi:hypothetical protein
MIKESTSIRPDRHLFLALRNNYSKLGMTADAKRIHEEMRSYLHLQQR